MNAKLLLGACAPLLLAAAALPDEDEIVFRPARDTRLTKTIEYSKELVLEESLYIENDEQEVLEQFEENYGEEFRVTFTDHFASVRGSRPLRLLRTYDAMEGRSFYDFSDANYPGEDSESVSDFQSVMEGETVQFTWDVQGEAYVAELVESQADGEWLEGLSDHHVEDLAFRFFLPGEAVAVGHRWKVDYEPLSRLLLDLEFEYHFVSDEDYGYFEDLEDYEDYGAGLPRARADQPPGDIVVERNGEVDARYAGVREEDGRRLAVIEVKAKLDDLFSWNDVDEYGQPVKTTFEKDFELEGEVLWDLEGGYLHGLLLEGKTSDRDSSVTNDEYDGEEYVMEYRDHYAGTVLSLIHI